MKTVGGLSPILAWGLTAVALAACADPVAEQAKRARKDAKLQMLGDAVFYWQCTHKEIQVAGECRPWSEAFERDRSTFRAKYGDEK
jgi:hypothetical protein